MSFFWDKIARPVMFGLDAERAHEIGVAAMRRRMASPFYVSDNSFGFGEINRFGLKFSNPLGLAAGFDKNGVVVDQLSSLGFGFVEVGTVTYESQAGNEKPRLFRLPDDKALINRLGFNNDGAKVVADRLRDLKLRCIVGVNIGKNKGVPNEEAVENYLASFDLVHPVADYIAVNISSPNTPNLRELQQSEHLEELLKSLQERNHVLSSNFSWPDVKEKPAKAGTLNGRKPLLVKIAPDLSESEIEEIVDICLRHEIDGIIGTNTTVSRDGLKSKDIADIGAGGLSGRPLTTKSNEIISTIYRHSKGKLPIIGVGGVFTARDAFDKIGAGASLIQAYTGFIYGGPTFARDVLGGLAKLLKEKGFESLDEAVGSAVV